MAENDRDTTALELPEAYRQLRKFRQKECQERLFVYPIRDPAEPTGFCYCEGSFWTFLRFQVKALMLSAAFRQPSNSLKVWMLRRMGATVGRGVYFSHGVWIDPTFPELIHIEDGVFFGMETRILTHEYRVDQFRAGRVVVHRGAFVGAFAIVACGIEIGENAVVSACCVAYRDVPAGATLVQRPPMIVPKSR